jgi:hypothetical protein
MIFLDFLFVNFIIIILLKFLRNIRSLLLIKLFDCSHIELKPFHFFPFFFIVFSEYFNCIFNFFLIIKGIQIKVSSLPLLFFLRIIRIFLTIFLLPFFHFVPTSSLLVSTLLNIFPILFYYFIFILLQMNKRTLVYKMNTAVTSITSHSQLVIVFIQFYTVFYITKFLIVFW